jgi:hypothetical protein
MEFSNIRWKCDIGELHALVWNNTMTCDIGIPCHCLKQYHDMWY